MTDDSKTIPYPEMMGDETEEQNLNQVGDPSARITEEEVDAAFGGAAPSPGVNGEGVSALTDRVNAMRDQVQQSAEAGLAALTETVNAMRDQVQQSAEAAKAWAAKQAEAAKQTTAEKPVLVVSVSAGAALALGIAVGFVLGRSTSDS